MRVPVDDLSHISEFDLRLLRQLKGFAGQGRGGRAPDPANLDVPSQPNRLPGGQSADLPAPGPPNRQPDGQHANSLELSAGTRAKLRHARILLRHSVPTGDSDAILDRALKSLIAELEIRRVGAGRPPRKCMNTSGHYVRASVRRAVWDRDEGTCTFVGVEGRRCSSRRLLEFEAVSAPGTTEATLRLRCRTHHEYAAELDREGVGTRGDDRETF